MFGIINFEAFIIAGILLNLTPGADTMYILGRSIANGNKAGVLSALGISVGSLVHTVFAAFGLSILIAESQLAFDIVKYLGAGYLIYLGLKNLLNKNDEDFISEQKSANQKNGRIFLSGMLTNILNPKVALFYLAFLPQFIDPNYPDHFITFIILGITFTITGTIWCLILAVFSAKLSDKIQRNYSIKIWLDRITGLVFILLGVKLVFSKLK